MLKNIINRKIFSVTPDQNVREVARLMARHNVGAILVCDQNGKKPIGIITDRDIAIKCVAEDHQAESCKASDLMTSSPATVQETDGLYDCIKKMHHHKVRRIAVVDHQGNATGLVTFGDVVGILSKELSELAHAGTSIGDQEKRTVKEKAA